MGLADRFRAFAAFDLAGASPLYERLAIAMAEDDDLISLLDSLPIDFSHVTSFFAAVNYLGGISDDDAAVRAFVAAEAPTIAELMSTHTTQTNEIGRCAVLLPAIGLVRGPVALLEVGASAGLNLLLDRFAYDYGSAGEVGDRSTTVVIPCEARAPFPVPSRLPEVVWRKGIDLQPVDVRDEEAVRWLEACVFADNVDRRDRLLAAIEIARQDPPDVVAGDLLELVEDLVAEAPRDATTVVFHSAVLWYLDGAGRARFEALMKNLNVLWLSNEVPLVIDGLKPTLGRLPSEICFVLASNGEEPLAFSHPHGRWMEWIDERHRPPHS